MDQEPLECHRTVIFVMLAIRMCTFEHQSLEISNTNKEQDTSTHLRKSYTQWLENKNVIYQLALQITTKPRLSMFVLNSLYQRLFWILIGLLLNCYWTLFTLLVYFDFTQRRQYLDITSWMMEGIVTIGHHEEQGTLPIVSIQVACIPHPHVPCSHTVRTSVTYILYSLKYKVLINPKIDLCMSLICFNVSPIWEAIKIYIYIYLLIWNQYC